MARQKGLEPLAYCLEGSCSIQLSYWRILERVTRIELASPAWKAGALTIVLHLQYALRGNRQLCYISMNWYICQEILSFSKEFFLSNSLYKRLHESFPKVS